MNKRLQWAVFVIVLLALAVVLCVQLLSSPWTLERLLAYQIKRNLPQADIRKIDIADYFWNHADEFVVKTLAVNARHKNEDYTLVIDEIRIFDWRNAFDPSKTLELSFTGAHLMSIPLRFSNGHARIKVMREKEELTGYAAIPYVIYQGVAVTSFNASVAVDGSRILVDDIHADLMEGSINGKFVVAYQDNMSYSMSMELKGLETAALPAAAGDVNKQIKALVDGSVAVEGAGNRIEKIQAHLRAPEGAYVNPLLLQLLTKYIPRSTQKEKLDEIVRTGKSIYLDRFNLDISTENSDQLKTAFDMKSKEFNIDIKLGVDINVDAGIMELLRSSTQFIPKERL